MKCGHCGYAFSVRFGQTKEGPIPYFVCSGKYLHKCCDVKQTHRVREIEAQVQARLIQEAEAYHLAREKRENNVIKQHQHRKKQLLIHQYSEALTEFNAVEIIPFTAEDWENMSFEDRRDIAKSMIDRVVLSEDGVDVRFK